MYIYIYICICMYIYIYIYMYVQFRSLLDTGVREKNTPFAQASLPCSTAADAAIQPLAWCFSGCKCPARLLLRRSAFSPDTGISDSNSSTARPPGLGGGWPCFSSIARPVLKSSVWKNGPSPWDICTFKGHFFFFSPRRRYR